jgi:succinate dehydrogenase (ubiquinone) membrane anchor subunit
LKPIQHLDTCSKHIVNLTHTHNGHLIPPRSAVAPAAGPAHTHGPARLPRLAHSRHSPPIAPGHQGHPYALALHKSTLRILTPPPSVNDAATVPDSSYAHGSYHWSFERLISAGLIPLTIAPFAAGSLNPVLDGLFISTILIHSHIGFQSCIIDYFPTKRVPKTRKFSMWALNAATVLAGIGFYEFETNDVGLTEGVKRIWQAKKPVL